MAFYEDETPLETPEVIGGGPAQAEAPKSPEKPKRTRTAKPKTLAKEEVAPQSQDAHYVLLDGEGHEEFDNPNADTLEEIASRMAADRSLRLLKGAYLKARCELV